MGYCGGDLMAMEGERERDWLLGDYDDRQGVAHQLTSTTGWLFVSQTATYLFIEVYLRLVIFLGAPFKGYSPLTMFGLFDQPFARQSGA
jgi:hypothetical protein